jgi:hypothetical protein
LKLAALVTPRFGEPTIVRVLEANLLLPTRFDMVRLTESEPAETWLGGIARELAVPVIGALKPAPVTLQL